MCARDGEGSASDVVPILYFVFWHSMKLLPVKLGYSHCTDTAVVLIRRMVSTVVTPPTTYVIDGRDGNFAWGGVFPGCCVRGFEQPLLYVHR